MAESGQRERIIKAIDFFRKFSDKADKQLYAKWVLSFCDLVEKELGLGKKGEHKEAEEIFKDVI